MEQIVFLTLCVGIVAFLYSSVGHAGASGYIAVMTLFSWEPAVIKPTALVLNVLVSIVATWQFYRRGHFQWQLFWPFAVLATPMAFLGGYLDLPTGVFKIAVGVILLFSAIRFLLRPAEDTVRAEPSLRVAIPVGGTLGFLAGLTGTGGGIFLTPLLLLMRWATTKQAAAASSLFILCNSAAGLLGNVAQTQSIPVQVVPLAITALLAGFAGSHFGSQTFPHTTIKRLLAIVLLIAGTKLILTAVN